MKTLQEKLDAVALVLEPVLWELLDEIEEKLIVSYSSCSDCIWFGLFALIKTDPRQKTRRQEVSTGGVYN